MFKKISIVLFLVLGLILVLVGCSSSTTPSTTSNPSNPATSSTPATPVSLKIGSLPRIFDLVLYGAQQDGVFQKNNLQVEIVPFRSVVERNNAFLAGQLDGFDDSIYEAINIDKDNDCCRVVGHNLMPDMFKIVVSPSSGITSPAQLKGKDIATSTATIMEYGLDTLLASAGISNKDVSYVNVPNMPLRLDMMAQGKLSAAILTPPLSEQALASGDKLVMDDSKQLLAGPALIFSNDALKNKSDGINRFIQSWQQAVRLINANPDKYRNLLVSTAQVPDTLAASYKVPAFPEMRLPTTDEVNVLVNWMKSKAMITSDFPYNKLVETKYLK
jgi:NitT/TauT family transport system substrate-binding protein